MYRKVLLDKNFANQTRWQTFSPGENFELYSSTRLSIVPLCYVDHDQLFFLVYEKVKYTKDNLEPHLWTYRSRITLEHLRQSFHDKKLMKTYPILYEFLQAVS